MTPEEVQAWSAATKSVIEIAKEAIAAWPTDKKKEEALRRIKEAELELAVSQGFELCRRHFPAGIMVLRGDTYRCLDCGLSDSDGAGTTPMKVQTHVSAQQR